MVKVSFHGLPL